MQAALAATQAIPAAGRGVGQRGKRAITAVVLFAGWFLSAQRAFTMEAPEQVLQELVSSSCVDCHSGTAPEGALDLDGFRDAEFVTDNRRQWVRILSRINAREMPPPDVERLADERLTAATGAIEQLLSRDTPQLDPGPVVIRRLNKYEYNATIRDLMGVHVEAGQGLPVDGAGGEGFDNAAETLFLSPVHIEKFVSAAKDTIEYVSRDASARELLFGVRPDETTTAREAASQVLRQFLTRAHRRPCSDQDLARYVKIFESEFAESEAFESSVLAAMQTALLSPYFLFRIESPNTTSEPQRVSDWELATRLSYFLWSSIPDEELLELAATNKLHVPAVLAEQVDRMLAAKQGSRKSEIPKVRALAENFMGQWLGTRDFGRRIQPDKELFGKLDSELESALRYEPVYYLEYMLEENRPLYELIDSDYTFLNRELARHYGIRDDVEIKGFGQIQHVPLPDGNPRGGVLTMGAALAVSSYPHRTSPVLRGTWMLETFFDVTLPPPPPDVPALDESTGEGVDQPLSLRERLEQHRNDAQCSVCHDRIDPLGFALENFDVLGRWRDEHAGATIDSSTMLPSGRKLTGAQDLKDALLERKDEFARGVTIKMLSYALGRGLVNSDFAAVEKIVQRLRENDYETRELIMGIVESVPFQFKSP